MQSWSDHCYHTTWKSLGLLKRLSEATARINHPLVVSSFKDNAGGMEFYDGWVVTIKGETHNFPSSIAPFGGIATKHGGVIRDTLGFGKGGYPIGGTTVMGTMDPRISEVPPGALHPQLIVSESIRATSYYTNPMGIPMMHPVYRIHPGYAKCFALGHSVGLIPKKYALKDAPRPGRCGPADRRRNRPRRHSRGHRQLHGNDRRDPAQRIRRGANRPPDYGAQVHLGNPGVAGPGVHSNHHRPGSGGHLMRGGRNGLRDGCAHRPWTLFP